MVSTASSSVMKIVGYVILRLISCSIAIMVFLAADSSRDMTTSPFAGGASAPAGPQDYNKLFKAEIDNLEFAQGLYSWVGNGVEDRVLKRYDKL
jgi:hypothetical protein